MIDPVRDDSDDNIVRYEFPAVHELADVQTGFRARRHRFAQHIAG
jgi:hypothetical protein